MSKFIKNPETFCKAFLAKFPPKPESSHLACDESTTWIKVIDGHPTTGECYIDGLPVVDYYAECGHKSHSFGVLNKVITFASSVGWEVQLRDPGTVQFFPV